MLPVMSFCTGTNALLPNASGELGQRNWQWWWRGRGTEELDDALGGRKELGRADLVVGVDRHVLEVALGGVEEGGRHVCGGGCGGDLMGLIRLFGGVVRGNGELGAEQSRAEGNTTSYNPCVCTDRETPLFQGRVRANFIGASGVRGGDGSSFHANLILSSAGVGFGALHLGELV
jgi:hypothetical protein